jgi:CRISPR system Cascade subunit CasC
VTQFLQLHLLTSYPPANLNRDDLGRPKTAIMGGKQRLRISSQSLKRAWRCSAIFEQALGQHRGIRTRRVGLDHVYRPMVEAGCTEKLAKATATKIAGVFGKHDSDHERLIKQLAHHSPEELSGVDELVELLVTEKREPKAEELKLLRRDHRAVDIALFGRMLADQPSYNVEAAAQVAHAISVHEVTIEDDYFTAVDDLNLGEEDAGAGHVNEAEFAAGLFYLYSCIDLDRLVGNLQGDGDLGRKTVRALVEAECKVAPSGKQNSFASRAYASYALAELGEHQPRSLSVSFLDPVRAPYLERAIQQLDETKSRFDAVYEATGESCSFDTSAGNGTISKLLDFAESGVARVST